MHNFWIIAVFVGISGGAGYLLGQTNGERNAQATVDYQRERDKIFDDQFAAIAAEPTGRDRVCHAIFDLVLDEASLEEFRVQEDMSEMPDNR